MKTETTQSHVLQFGQLDFDGEVLKDFFGENTSLRGVEYTASPSDLDLASIKKTSSLDSRDINLHYLTNKYLNAQTFERKQKYSALLKAEITHRENMDSIFNAVSSTILQEKVKEMISAPVNTVSFDCLRAVNDVVDAHCGRYSDYSLKYVKHVAVMCEHHVGQGMDQLQAANVIADVLKAECSKTLTASAPYK